MILFSWKEGTTRSPNILVTMSLILVEKKSGIANHYDDRRVCSEVYGQMDKPALAGNI